MEKIIPLKAKFIMDEDPEAIILDVRNLDEYLSDGHIPGAQLIPLPELSQRAPSELPDKDSVILVYCRSGARSEMAAEILDGMGYTGVKDFGGLMDWPFEIER